MRNPVDETPLLATKETGNIFIVNDSSPSTEIVNNHIKETACNHNLKMVYINVQVLIENKNLLMNIVMIIVLM